MLQCASQSRDSFFNFNFYDKIEITKFNDFSRESFFHGSANIIFRFAIQLICNEILT